MDYFLQTEVLWYVAKKKKKTKYRVSVSRKSCQSIYNEEDTVTKVSRVQYLVSRVQYLVSRENVSH